jgi:DNA-binding beta-propeller fold protein YncE
MRLFCTALLSVTAAASATAQLSGLGGTLVVTNKTPSTATIIDVGSGRTLATLPTGAGPHEVVMSANGLTAIVTDYAGTPGNPGKTLTVLSLAQQRVLRTIDLGQYTRPHGIAFLPPGDTMVVVTSEATGNIVIVNLRTGAMRAIATMGQGSHMLGVSADGRWAATGNMGSHTASLIDLNAGSFVKSWPVPNTPEAINITPDGKEIWVGSNQTGKLSVIDVATGTTTTVAEGFGWPYRVAFTPSMNTLLVPDLRNEELRFIDRNTRRERSRLALKDAGPQGITFTPDGRYAFLSLSKQARVAIVDVDKQMIVGYLASGETPDGVAYSPRAFSTAMPPSTARPADVASIDAIIAVLYESISGGAGVKRDWNRFLSLFAPNARLIPTGRRPDSTQVMRAISPEEYAATVGPQLETGGFFEREIGRETAQFGAIAHVFSAYDSKRLATDAQPFARGINSIQLFNDGKRWYVVTIFWDPERPDNRIPSKYLQKN